MYERVQEEGKQKVSLLLDASIIYHTRSVTVTAHESVCIEHLTYRIYQ